MTIVVHTPLDRLCVLAKRLHQDARVIMCDAYTTVRTPRRDYTGADIASCTRAVESALTVLGVELD